MPENIDERKWMQAKELNHGRLAMIAVIGRVHHANNDYKVYEYMSI